MAALGKVGCHDLIAVETDPNSSRDHQTGWAAHAAARVHRRGTGRRVPLRDVQEAADPRTTMSDDASTAA